MTIEKFVAADSIDPVYLTPLFWPRMATRARVYAVLREAIGETGKIALSRVVISQRERTIALRPVEDGLMAHTLYESET